MGDQNVLVDSAFVGFARINFSRLIHKRQKIYEIVNKQPPSVRKRVNNLVKVFDHEGCIREERHAIHVVVLQDDLQHQRLPKSLPIKVADVPQLQLDAICIHGIHRVLAGCEHLAPNDQWWLARVFTRGKAI